MNLISYPRFYIQKVWVREVYMLLIKIKKIYQENRNLNVRRIRSTILGRKAQG